MNKLTAPSKLANAYHHLEQSDALDNRDATEEIKAVFGYIRRSLRIEDLKPVPEGLNGKGPTFF